MLSEQGIDQVLAIIAIGNVCWKPGSIGEVSALALI